MQKACGTVLTIAILLSASASHGQSGPLWLNQGTLAKAHDVAYLPGGGVAFIGAGWFQSGTVAFGGHVVDGDADSSSVLLGKLDSHSNLVWARQGAFSLEKEGIWHNTEIIGFGLTADLDGNLYTSEGFPFAYDSGMFTQGGVSVNKYAPNGSHLWTAGINPSTHGSFDQPAYVSGLGTDRSGNIYAAGIYRDTLALPPDTLAPFPLEAPEYFGDVFLVSYDSSGTVRWSRRIGGPRHDVIAEWRESRATFAVDRHGNTYMGGFFSKGATFGEGQEGEVTLARDAYALASYDSTGTFRWMYTERDLGISDNAGPWRIAVDNVGNLIVDWAVLRTNKGRNVATVGDSTFVDPGFGGEFLTKISQQGELLWATQIESDGNDLVENVVTDENNHVYVTGLFDGWYLRTGDIEIRKQDLQLDVEDSFIAHYDSNGKAIWVGHAGGRGTQRIRDIDVSPGGDIYAFGDFFGGVMVIDGDEVTPENRDDVFLAKFSAEEVTSSDPFPEGNGEVAISLHIYPNPSKGRTVIEYIVEQPSDVHISIFDALGRQLRTLVDQFSGAGSHRVTFDGSLLPSGTYLVRLEALQQSTTELLTIIQ